MGATHVHFSNSRGRESAQGIPAREVVSARSTSIGRFELTVRSKLLAKPIYYRFDNESEARRRGVTCGFLPDDACTRRAESTSASLTGKIFGQSLARAWPELAAKSRCSLGLSSSRNPQEDIHVGIRIAEFL